MSRHEFKVAVSSVVTFQGNILLGKKEEESDRIIAGQWHFPGGFVEKDESPEEAIERELREETDLNGEIFQLVDVNSSKDTDVGPDNIIRIVYHIEAGSRDVEAGADLEEVKWVEPEELENEIGEMESQYLDKSDRIPNFIEKLRKMPAF